jgi:hypothetical protein
MPDTSLASTLHPHDRAARSPDALARASTGCPSWCTVRPDRCISAGHVAHRTAIWELPDRVELCVMQIVSDDPADVVPAKLPILYFWSAESAVFSDEECAEMAHAIRRAGEVLCGLVAVGCG